MTSQQEYILRKAVERLNDARQLLDDVMTQGDVEQSKYRTMKVIHDAICIAVEKL